MTVPEGTLTDYLQELHAQAGYPPYRGIAAAVQVSHSWVADALKGRSRRPRWHRVLALVIHLGGDGKRASTLWRQHVNAPTAKSPGSYLAGWHVTKPSALLIAAADYIKALAANATPAPWIAYGENDTEEFVRTARGYYVVRGLLALADAQWIAAWSPVAAKPLEEWLRQAAKELEQAWTLFEPGTTRFALTDSGEVSMEVWTEESRLQAIQSRWGSVLRFAEAILPEADVSAGPSQSDSEGVGA